ncbi:hypothetical protein KA005_33140 [bacterium]|nr:hypothetical protein [bacterium]
MSRICPCGSGKFFSACCEKYMTLVEGPTVDPNETLLLGWLEKYGPPTSEEFMKKARTYVFRISWYLDGVLEKYHNLGFRKGCTNQETADEMIYFIKHNTLLSIYGALSCLGQGLFIQSGILLRSVFENCMILVDLFENQGQVEKMLKDKYSTTGVVARVKDLVPSCMVKWYGYFSSNFAHFGPIHPAPYMPRKCWPDNWVLVTGIQNIVRGSVGFGITLERCYFSEYSHCVFWRDNANDGRLIFVEEAPIWDWIEELGKEIVGQYPPNERKEGFTYTENTYKLK